MKKKETAVKCLIQYSNVLKKEANKNLLNYIATREKLFAYTGGKAYSSIKKYHEWRKSKVLYHWDFKEFVPHFEEVIHKHFEEVCKRLNIEPFKIQRIDFQLTSHNDGEQFRLHKDKSTKLTEDRMITFVYYFHSAVKKFTGGELLFPENGRIKVEPVNNTIVFFDPTLTHEVLQVSCPSKKFEDGRFTINGWVNREPKKKGKKSKNKNLLSVY
jgi:SM-20-related protein